MINSFSGEYRFLSNFYPITIFYEKMGFPSVEHAFQAAKTLNINDRIIISKALTPGTARSLGRSVELRPEWDHIKDRIMFSLLWQKFNHEIFEKKLINTHPCKLEEGNTWKDTYWGTCKGFGQNKLGVMLMTIRQHKMKKGAAL